MNATSAFPMAVGTSLGYLTMTNNYQSDYQGSDGSRDPTSSDWSESEKERNSACEHRPHVAGASVILLLPRTIIAAHTAPTSQPTVHHTCQPNDMMSGELRAKAQTRSANATTTDIVAAAEAALLLFDGTTADPAATPAAALNALIPKLAKPRLMTSFWETILTFATTFQISVRRAKLTALAAKSTGTKSSQRSV